MGICFPRRICWFSIFLVVQKQFAWKIDLTYLGFWCFRKREKHILGYLWGFKEPAVLCCDDCSICRADSICKIRQAPQIPWWDKQQESRFWEELTLALFAQLGSPGLQAFVWKELNLGMAGETPNKFPSTSAPAWPYTLNVQPGDSWGNQRDHSPLPLQTTPAHTYSNSALRLEIWVERLTQTAEKFQGFQVKFS